MEWALNVAGLVAQIVGVVGIIVWYLARVQRLTERTLGKITKRLLVRFRLWSEPPGAGSGGSTATVRVEAHGAGHAHQAESPKLHVQHPSLEERVAALEAGLRRETDQLSAKQQEQAREQQKQAKEHAATMETRAAEAKQSEHNAALVGAASSAMIVLGLVLQLVGALVS